MHTAEKQQGLDHEDCRPQTANYAAQYIYLARSEISSPLFIHHRKCYLYITCIHHKNDPEIWLKTTGDFLWNPSSIIIAGHTHSMLSRVFMQSQIDYWLLMKTVHLVRLPTAGGVCTLFASVRHGVLRHAISGISAVRYTYVQIGRRLFIDPGKNPGPMSFILIQHSTNTWHTVLWMNVKWGKWK